MFLCIPRLPSHQLQHDHCERLLLVVDEHAAVLWALSTSLKDCTLTSCTQVMTVGAELYDISTTQSRDSFIVSILVSVSVPIARSVSVRLSPTTTTSATTTTWRTTDNQLAAGRSTCDCDTAAAAALPAASLYTWHASDGVSGQTHLSSWAKK